MKKLLLIEGEWHLAEGKAGDDMLRLAQSVILETDAKFREFFEEKRNTKRNNQMVSSYAFRAALIKSGKSEADVQQAISTIQDPELRALTKNYWDNSGVVTYGNVYLQKIREQMSLNMDTLFAEAPGN
jgi:hypothetical protein